MARKVSTEENDIEERATSRLIRLEEPSRWIGIEEPPREYYEYGYRIGRSPDGDYYLYAVRYRYRISPYPPLPAEGLTVNKGSPEEE